MGFVSGESEGGEVGRTAQVAGGRALFGLLNSVGIGKESYCSFVNLEFKYIILKGLIM